MSNPFVGEIRMVGFNYAPVGWAFCDGQILPIQQNTALFSLLGVSFGGNGTSNYGLPNLQGNVAMDFGDGQGLTPRSIGETGGAPNVTILQTELPPHTHTMNGTSVGGSSLSPTGSVYSVTPGLRGHDDTFYIKKPLTNPIATHPTFVGPTGGNLPHNNSQPYLVLNFIISLQGIYPPRP